jgi:aspartate ammonia-lyase
MRAPTIVNLATTVAAVWLCAAPAFGDAASHRTEKDLLGEKQIPAGAYYGVQTARALENFQISGTHLNDYPELVNALAMVKLAAARANHDVGARRLRAQGIEQACQAIIGGKYHDQFLVDMYQGGAEHRRT